MLLEEEDGEQPSSLRDKVTIFCLPCFRREEEGIWRGGGDEPQEKKKSIWDV